MNTIYRLTTLFALTLSAFGADVKFSSLPTATSPSTNSYLPIIDLNLLPAAQNEKYLLTNLAAATPAGITNALGYVPVNKAGDTMTGALTSPQVFATNYFSVGASGTCPAYDLRNATWYTSPVAVLRPQAAGEIVLDLMPHTGSKDVWIDLVSTDILASQSNYETLKLWKKGNGIAEITTTKNGTGTLRELALQSAGGSLRIGDTAATPVTFYPSWSSGELNAGALLVAGTGVSITPGGGGGTSGKSIQLGYYNGSAYYSAVEFTNTSSGFSTLSLMKSGGTVKAPAYTISGTTNQVVFGATNTAPVSAAAPTKWISVQVSGESTVYRLALYE